MVGKSGAGRETASVSIDIDETALSNWEIIKLDDFGRPIEGACAPALDAPLWLGGVGSART